MRLRSIPRRIAAGIGLVLISAAAALVASAALSGGRSGASKDVPGTLTGFPASKRSPHSFDPKKLASDRLGPGVSLVARARRGAAVVHAGPGGRGRARTLRGLPVGRHHAPLVFLVRRRHGAWVQVYLPVRPNRSTGWVRAAGLTLARDPYRLEVRLRSHRLLAWKAGRVVARERIGTGRAVTPTPHGRYFLADLLRPPDPRGFYGPYAFGLSAYSPVLTSFAGGDGQIGIHGTNAPALLGTDVSHGCIRLRNAAIRRLARRVPLGTPVVIRD